MFTAYAAVIAAQAADATAPGNHLWEIVLAAATVGLAIATTVLILATRAADKGARQLAKVLADDAAALAHNSIDSMENVAVEAIHHDDRRATALRMATHRPVRSHRRHRV